MFQGGPPGRVESPCPAIRSEVIPKPGGGTRTVTHPGPRERHRYGAAVADVVIAVERGLSRGVAANRARRSVSGLALEPWPIARRRYLRTLASELEKPYGALFVGDVRDCFGSITPATVERALRRIAAPAEGIRSVGAVLEWFGSNGVQGLPVGPQPSSVLANAVLAPVDRALAEAARGPVFRWVDDVIVVATDVRAAHRAEEAFARSLAALGLEPHPGKCRIVDDPAMASAIERPSALVAPRMA